jgi:transcription elongation factor Elf1
MWLGFLYAYDGPAWSARPNGIPTESDTRYDYVDNALFEFPRVRTALNEAYVERLAKLRADDIMSGKEPKLVTPGPAFYGSEYANLPKVDVDCPSCGGSKTVKTAGLVAQCQSCGASWEADPMRPETWLPVKEGTKPPVVETTITCPECMGTGEWVVRRSSGEYASKVCDKCQGSGQIPGSVTKPVSKDTSPLPTDEQIIKAANDLLFGVPSFQAVYGDWYLHLDRSKVKAKTPETATAEDALALMLSQASLLVLWATKLEAVLESRLR